MGIRLDWEIENERSQTRSSGEDPAARGRRGRALRRLLLMFTLLGLLIAGIVGIVQWRLAEADAAIRQNLINTVENEVAAIRIGDRNTFTTIQRSESATWLQGQQDEYDRYQQLKTQPNVILSGRVVNSVIDGPRGRVQVEEIIDGLPYVRTRFYFLYDDGWRRVPPDYTFWGEALTRNIDSVTIRAFAVDAPVADLLAARVPTWIATGCAMLTCPTPPTLTLDLVPDEGLVVSWSADDPSVLRIPSPYIGVTRLDAPLSSRLEVEIAAQIAERLVTSVRPLQPIATTDAAYLYQAIQSTLVERFTGVETNAHSIDSLTATYGEDALGRLLLALTPDSTMIALASAVGVPSVDQLPLDWRDVLTWRLALEQRLIAEQLDGAFLALYDTADPAVRDLALARYTGGALSQTAVVTQVNPIVDTSGRPALGASVLIIENGVERTEDLLFRLVDGIWKRAS